jgi:hypothetical protein
VPLASHLEVRNLWTPPDAAVFVQFPHAGGEHRPPGETMQATVEVEIHDS